MITEFFFTSYSFAYGVCPICRANNPVNRFLYFKIQRSNIYCRHAYIGFHFSVPMLQLIGYKKFLMGTLCICSRHHRPTSPVCLGPLNSHPALQHWLYLLNLISSAKFLKVWSLPSSGNRLFHSGLTQQVLTPTCLCCANNCMLVATIC